MEETLRAVEAGMMRWLQATRQRHRQDARLSIGIHVAGKLAKDQPF